MAHRHSQNSVSSSGSQFYSNRAWLLILLCLTLFASAPAWAAPRSDDDEETSKTHKDWAAHEDLVHGFKLRYPTEWEVRKGLTEHVLVTFVSALPPAGHSADAVTISFVEEKRKKLDLDAVLAAALKNAQETSKDFKLIDKGSSTLDNHPAKKLVYRGKADNGVQVETTTIFTFLDDGRFFSISLVTDPDRRNDFRPVMKEILESFKTFEPK